VDYCSKRAPLEDKKIVTLGSSNSEHYNVGLHYTTGCTRMCPWCYAKYLLYKKPIQDHFELEKDSCLLPKVHAEELQKLELAADCSKFMISPLGDVFDNQISDMDIYRLFRALREHADAGHIYFLFTRCYDRAVRIMQNTKFIAGLCLVLSANTQQQAADAYRHLQELSTAQYRGMAISPLREPIIIPGRGHRYLDWLMISGDQKKKVANTYVMVGQLLEQARDRGIHCFLKEYGYLNVPDVNITGFEAVPRLKTRTFFGEEYNYMPDGTVFKNPCLCPHGGC